MIRLRRQIISSTIILIFLFSTFTFLQFNFPPRVYAGTTDVFTSGFEVGKWDSQWDGNGATTWTVGTNSTPGLPWVTHSGTNMSYQTYWGDTEQYSLISDDIDLSGATSAGVSFWYMVDDEESADYRFYYYNGSTHNVQTLDLGSATTEDIWWKYSEVITDSQYLKSNFRIEFLSQAETGEASFVDDVLVNKTVPDTIKPTFSSISTNTTTINQPCNFSVTLADETGLANYTFGTNNTGTWTNESATTISGTSYKANSTYTLNSTVGAVIQWEIWFADSSNNLNNTGVQSFVLFGIDVIWVNAFNSTLADWVEVGDSPYLSDSESYICYPSINSVESWFGFEQTSKTVQQADLYIQGVNANVTVTLSNGAANYTYNFHFGTAAEWVSANVSNAINSQTKANAAKMSITALEAGNSLTQIIRCYIRVFNGGAYGEVFASDQRAEHTCQFSVQWTDPDGMSSYAFNHNASGSWLGTNITGSLSGVQAWSNESITLQSDSTGFISVVFYTNDTNNNWETTNTQTFPVISKYFDEDYLNNVGQSGSISTQHSLGRSSFYIQSLGFYIQLWGNSTHEVYSVSSDGKTWNFSGAIRERGNYAGYMYSYHEYRDGVNYLHYMYCAETVDNLYYRRGVINADGSITFPVAEQTVVLIAGLDQIAVDGLCTDPSGHVFMTYFSLNGSTRTFNVTCNSAIDGTWATQSGYPQTVSTSAASYEGYVVPLLEDWDAYIVYTQTGEKPKGRMIDNNVLQSDENISDNAVYEIRHFSVVSDPDGNVHFVYVTSTYAIEYSLWNYTSKTWSIKGEYVAQGEATSYPIIAYDYYSNSTFVNWFTTDQCWAICREAQWQNLTSIFIVPDGYKLTSDPNVLVPLCSRNALIGFQTQNTTSALYYEWAYLYVLPSLDVTSPTYSGMSTNSTIWATVCNFSITITDETILHSNGQYIFGCNNTRPALLNETEVMYFTTTPETVSITKTLNSTNSNATSPMIIQYEWWFSDNAGNWNNTGIQTLTLSYPLIVGWNNVTIFQFDVGYTLAGINASLTYDDIDWSYIVYQNNSASAQYVFVKGMSANTETVVYQSTGILLIFSNQAKNWTHTYPYQGGGYGSDPTPYIIAAIAIVCLTAAVTRFRNWWKKNRKKMIK